MNQPDKMDRNYDRLRKITSSFEELKDANARPYSPLENLAVVEVIVPFREKCIFKWYIPKTQMLWYIDLQTVQQDGLYSIYNMSIYFGKDTQNKKIYSDSYTCSSEKFHFESRRGRPHTLHG